MNKFKCIIFQDIVAPYKTLLFNALEKCIGGEFKVLHLCKTDRIREWKVVASELKFPFEVIFECKKDGVNTVKLAIGTFRRLNYYNPQVIIIEGYNSLACWAALVWGKIRKRKVMVIIESHYLDKGRTRVKEKIKKLFVSNCDAALVAGIRHKDYAISLGLDSKNIFITKGPGAIDVSLYQRKISRSQNGRIKLCNNLGMPLKNFLFVGRFAPEKNIIFLLKVYSKLRDEGLTDWGLILVGNGPQKKDIEDFISKTNIEKVLLPGFKEKEELVLFYGISNVLILPSISEPWGLVVNEAMACGLPVLVSNRCGCYPDIVHEGINGFTFSPMDEDELFNLMKDITNWKYNLEEMGKASLEIIKDYTSEKAAEVYLNAINFVFRTSS